MATANNAYMMWRHYAGGMAKLQALKGATPQISAEQVAPKVDWSKEVLGTVKGGLELAGVVRDESFKKAESYMKSNTIEEYRKAASEGNLPFQDDPIAMARLKNLHGGTAASIAYQDFMNRVNNNEFNGSTPEQVDAAFFKHMNESFDELRDLYPYSEGGDSAYNSGFWQNGDVSRDSVRKQFTVVQNDWNRKQSSLAENAALQAVIDTPGVTVDQIMEHFDGAYLTGAFQSNATEASKTAEFILNKFGTMSGGESMLDQIADKMVPGSNIKFKDLIGNSGMESLKYGARSAKETLDYRDAFDFRSEVDNLVRNDDMISLQTGLDQELKASGDVKTPRAEYLAKAIDRLEKQREQQAKADAKVLEKQIEDNQKRLMARDVLSAMANGETVADLSELKLDKGTVNAAWSEIKEGLKGEQLLKIASNPAHSNPARDELRANVNNVLNEIRSHIDLVANGEQLPAEVGVPKGAKEMLALYQTNPSGFLTAMGGLGNEKLNDLMGMQMALQSGIPYKDVVAGRAAFEKTDKKQRMDKDKILKKIVLSDAGETSSPVKGDYATSYVYVLAAQGIKNGMDSKAAYDSAIDRFNETHINVAGTAVPKGFFESTSYRLPPEVAGDAIDKKLQGVLKSHNVVEKDSAVRYDVRSNSLLIQDSRSGELIGQIMQSDLKADYDAYVAAETKRRQEVDKKIKQEQIKEKTSSAMLNATAPNLMQFGRDVKQFAAGAAKNVFKAVTNQ